MHKGNGTQFREMHSSIYYQCKRILFGAREGQIDGTNRRDRIFVLNSSRLFYAFERDLVNLGNEVKWRNWQILTNWQRQNSPCSAIHGSMFFSIPPVWRLSLKSIEKFYSSTGDVTLLNSCRFLFYIFIV